MVLRTLRAFQYSNEPVFYGLVSSYGSLEGKNNVNHGTAMIQVRSDSEEPAYLVIQSYGWVYGLHEWLNRKRNSPFQGWMNFEMAQHFWARAMCSFIWTNLA